MPKFGQEPHPVLGNKTKMQCLGKFSGAVFPIAPRNRDYGQKLKGLTQTELFPSVKTSEITISLLCNDSATKAFTVFYKQCGHTCHQ